jgi:transposase-like protein
MEQLKKRPKEEAKMLAEAAGDILAFTAFPKSIMAVGVVENPQKRLNRESRRCPNVAGRTFSPTASPSSS